MDMLPRDNSKANKDPGNAAAQNLIVLIVILASVGLILLIVGFVGHSETVGYGSVHVVNGGALLGGGALLFLALQGAMGAMLYTAWRHEHRGLGGSGSTRPNG